jgi:antitoxin (DNA-binding transcriptional repressor) of toxin-antitoxin stability system
MVRSVNIRALKDRLSAFLRGVQRGDVILVTDRGRVVAEIRLPTVDPSATGTAAGSLRRLATEGVVKLGLPNRADAYRKPAVRLPDKVVDDALGFTRGERCVEAPSGSSGWSASMTTLAQRAQRGAWPASPSPSSRAGSRSPG